MNNNLPVIKEKDTIFTKIKIFFKNLFNANNNVQNYSFAGEKGEIMNNTNRSFADGLKIKENKEEQELLELQKKFENGLITEEELTEEQINKLEQLYNEQIKKLNEKFLNYKNKIVSIKKQLAENN